jgi:hypothetical protein
MSELATKDDLKATIAALEKSIDLQANKLTFRVGLMMWPLSSSSTL